MVCTRVGRPPAVRVPNSTPAGQAAASPDTGALCFATIARKARAARRYMVDPAARVVECLTALPVGTKLLVARSHT
jgi:hypothetical protein